jgi:hypothetical protein
LFAGVLACAFVTTACDDNSSGKNQTTTSGPATSGAPASVQQGQTGNTTQDSVDDLNKQPSDDSTPAGPGSGGDTGSDNPAPTSGMNQQPGG